MEIPNRPRMRMSACIVLLLALTSQAQKKKFEGRKHWWDLAQNELAAALNVRDNWNVAKNVIMFLGDGMGITANTAGRIFKGQKEGRTGEEGYLQWERFPSAGLLKTYNVDKQVPDSAATATAYLCGVKANFYTLGVDPSVTLNDCSASKNPLYHTSSILQWAQDAGKDTGVVTTTRITHATPAATYAHSANRNWECDGGLGQLGAGCKDIANQLITENPGKNFKVIMGGGRQALGANLKTADPNICARKDGRNLTEEWLKQKKDDGYSARYVTTTAQLNAVDVDETDYLMGLFGESHTPYEIDRLKGPSGTPSLKEMTLKAIEFLQKSEEGFVLLVEGGRIDHALHNNNVRRSLEEIVAMDEAVAAALDVLDLEETLVVVTADHSHVMTINGYPDRGNDILGITGDNNTLDGIPYTTLMFTNGPGYKYTTDGHKVIREDPRTVNTRHEDYKSQAAVPLPQGEETHGGEDVAVWAIGPMSHLFHRTHEQHYVAHVMAYASCVGPSAGSKCQRPSHAHITKGPVPKGVSGGLPSKADTAAFAANLASSLGIRSSSSNSGVPKFHTLTPALQQLLDDNEEKILAALGRQVVARFSSASDVKSLLGQSVVPHVQ